MNYARGYGPRKATIIKRGLAFECDHQYLLEIVGAVAHNLLVRILEDMIPSDVNIQLPNGTAENWLRAEVGHLAAEIALVLWGFGNDQGGQTLIVPC